MVGEKYRDCLEYIDSYWDRIIFPPTKKRVHRHSITIPHTFFTPNDQKFSYIFYWDSYFMFRGLLDTKRRFLMKSMMDNFIYLFDRFHIIPNFDSPTATGRSQPPFFTSMIQDVYSSSLYKQDLKERIKNLFKNVYKVFKQQNWLEKAVDTARREYKTVWDDPHGFYHHRVKGYQLNRYGDTDLGYAHSSEIESGWDFTSRFYSRCSEFLPIDLNVYLYKYETDLAFFASLINDKKEERFWIKKATARQKEINRLMWNEEKGFFFDYGYFFARQSDFWSLAGFTPLWVGLASKQQAKKMARNLSRFETDHGLVVTAKESLAPQISLRHIPHRYRPAIEEVIKPKQWDYPHSWPPLEYLTVVGLLKYGFIKEAEQIMKKSVETHARLFRKYGTFFEKIDGVRGDKPSDFHYQTQAGFGWTNAIFYRYVKILEAIESGVDIYQTPKSKTPPYELAILY